MAESGLANSVEQKLNQKEDGWRGGNLHKPPPRATAQPGGIVTTLIHHELRVEPKVSHLIQRVKVAKNKIKSCIVATLVSSLIFAVADNRNDLSTL